MNYGVMHPLKQCEDTYAYIFMPIFFADTLGFAIAI